MPRRGTAVARGKQAGRECRIKPAPKPGQQMPADIVSLHNNVISFQIRPSGWSGGRARRCSLCMHQPSGCQDRGHAGFTDVVSQALGEGRRRQIAVALGIKTRRAVWQNPASIHPSVHSTNIYQTWIQRQALLWGKCQGGELAQPGPFWKAPGKKQSPQGWGEASLGNGVGQRRPVCHVLVWY